MGIAAYVTDTTTDETTSFPVVGANELGSLWAPIIKHKNLHFLDYLVSAGLSIDGENQLDVLNELQTLLGEIKRRGYNENEYGSPANRCRRLVDLIARFDPNESKTLYVG